MLSLGLHTIKKGQGGLSWHLLHIAHTLQATLDPFTQLLAYPGRAGDIGDEKKNDRKPSLEIAGKLI